MPQQSSLPMKGLIAPVYSLWSTQTYFMILGVYLGFLTPVIHSGPSEVHSSNYHICIITPKIWAYLAAYWVNNWNINRTRRNSVYPNPCLEPLRRHIQYNVIFAPVDIHLDPCSTGWPRASQLPRIISTRQLPDPGPEQWNTMPSPELSQGHSPLSPLPIM